MRFIGFLTLLLSLLSGAIATLNADPLTHSNPMTDCLNNHIFPQLGSDAQPEEIVNHAFLLCKPFVDSWLVSYPDPCRQQLDRALRQFYLDRLSAARNRSDR